MKKFYFLCGLPRCGNTLLSSILNQNSNISVTANSIVPGILYDLQKQYETEIFKNFSDYNSLDNVMKNIFFNYYQNWKSEIIIDRGPWGTDFNYDILKALNLNTKFILIERPILEILASFVKIENPKDIDKRCNHLMSDEGMIGKYLISHNNLKNKNNVLLLRYDDICFNIENVIDKIYNFLDIKKFNHNFKDIKQFEVNDTHYNDKILDGDLHTVRTDSIKKDIYNVEDYLPVRIIEKYEKIK